MSSFGEWMDGAYTRFLTPTVLTLRCCALTADNIPAVLANGGLSVMYAALAAHSGHDDVGVAYYCTTTTTAATAATAATAPTAATAAATATAATAYC